MTGLRRKALRNNISIINLVQSSYGTGEKSPKRQQRFTECLHYGIFGILWEVDTANSEAVQAAAHVSAIRAIPLKP